jgi:CelD/BcsL family acetyltransferase involved in cellulose biosynthesis
VTIERYADLETIRAEWSPLAESCGNVFATWEWNETWWRQFGSRRKPVVLALRSPLGPLRGIIPLYRSVVRPLRIVRLLGHGPADQAALVYDASDTSCPADLIEAARNSLTRVDLLIVEQLPATAHLVDMAGPRILARQSAPVIKLAHSSWTEYLMTLGSESRSTIRRKERRLARRRSVTFRLTQQATELERDLDVLFSLHRMRWPGSSFMRLQRFHRDFAATALRNGWLRLWILEVDGVAAAAWYGFRFANTEHYYQSGWHPDFAAESVGQVLLAHTIRAALEDGAAEYRFGRGGEAYKYHYAKEDTALVTLAWSRSRLGAGALRVAPLVQRFGPARRLRRAFFDQR